MRSRAPWPQMAVATVLVMVLPAVVVGGLTVLGVVSAVWVGALLAVALSLVVASAGSAYWRRHATGDVLFSDLLLWGWLRRRRTERRLGRADELLREAGDAGSARKAQLLRELGSALDNQDPYLDGHSRRVARYVTMIAQRMHVPDAQVERAEAAATIHDVGKLRVPAEVVHKPGRLTDAEFDVMRQHAAAGGAMVECLDDPALAAAVRGHHERWDGSGYPDGLVGEGIPVEARMISVADTFDAITSARPYRPATPHARALKVIADEAGHQLDPEAARAFISCYSDRRGAALWAGLVSLPRQVAARLSLGPGELTGVLAAALTTPLVMAAGALAAAALPVRSDDPAHDPPVAEQQAVATTASTSTPQPNRPSSTTTPGSSPAAAGTDQAATGGATPAPPARAVAGETARSARTRTASATPTPTPAERPLLPDALPPVFPTAAPTPGPGPPLPTATPTASPEPGPTPSPEPEPTPPAEPTPTPEPLPPLLAETLPVFPTPTPAPPSHTADDCRNGGWMDLGYPNQGRCIADAVKGPRSRAHR